MGEASAASARLLLVDDHPLYHAGLKSVLAALRPSYSLASASDATEGLARLAAGEDVDLVLVDIVLPGADGFEAVAEYGRQFPHIPRVLISGRDDPATQVRASRCGASGFVSKAWPADHLLWVAERVLAGDSGFDAPAGVAPRLAAGGLLCQQDLTLRQIEVLTLLAEGKSNKEIADALDIADRTVRAHLTDMFQALGVASRVQAVLQAQALGLVA
jgi:DNA-binding NarL/FixJ family response regulator